MTKKCGSKISSRDFIYDITCTSKIIQNHRQPTNLMMTSVKIFRELSNIYRARQLARKLKFRFNTVFYSMLYLITSG